MRNRAPVRRALAAAAGTALLLTGTVAFTPAASAHTVQSAPSAAPLSAGDGTPAGAVAWYKAHIGSTAYQNYCELAAEKAYGTSGVWASANAHWNGAGPKHTTGTPPAGSFVYWNISAYGHVGISDGKGGAYASSVKGAIGHITSLSYFANYRGWTPGAVPHT
ncbi:MAG TPA: CHAP domain-containing protein [Streptosporangiaceae bacterium]|jgi:hypothetical protein